MTLNDFAVLWLGANLADGYLLYLMVIPSQLTPQRHAAIVWPLLCAALPPSLSEPAQVQEGLHGQSCISALNRSRQRALAAILTVLPCEDCICLIGSLEIELRLGSMFLL